MTHAQLVQKAVEWLRRYRCGVILSEQACATGEMPDAIGWKRACHSVLVECKISRADFLADRDKPWRRKPEIGLGCERYYLTPAGLLSLGEVPAGWGWLELRQGKITRVRASMRNLRHEIGFRYEMNLLLASLRRVEVRIEPQTITEFLKWKNRMAEYNRGGMPQGIVPLNKEGNLFLKASTYKIRKAGMFTTTRRDGISSGSTSALVRGTPATDFARQEYDRDNPGSNTHS